MGPLGVQDIINCKVLVMSNRVYENGKEGVLSLYLGWPQGYVEDVRVTEADVDDLIDVVEEQDWTLLELGEVRLLIVDVEVERHRFHGLLELSRISFAVWI